MKRNSSWIMSCLAVIAMLSLTSCGTATLRSGKLDAALLQKSGIVYASLIRPNGLQRFPVYSLVLQPAGEEVPVLFRPVEGLRVPRYGNFEEGGIIRSLFAAELPPGEYTLERIELFIPEPSPGFGSYSWKFDFPQSQRLVVEAGKSYYVGANIIIPTIKENWAGVDTLNDPVHVYRSDFEADTAVAKRLFPNLPEVTTPDWVPEAMVDAEEVIKRAREINSDPGYWLGDSWEKYAPTE